MAAPLRSVSFCLSKCSCIFISSPARFISRSHALLKRPLLKGKDPRLMQSFDQIIEERNAADPELDKPIDIGLPPPPLTTSRRRQASPQADSEMERKARHNKLVVDYEEAFCEWVEESGPEHVLRAAQHYGVFSDLFDNAYFWPRVPLLAEFSCGDDDVMPVFRGNVIMPSEAAVAPDVTWACEEDSLWTLVMTSPDGCIADPSDELLHWAVGNIPGADVSRGETWCPYMPPLPARGAGYLRYVLLLYRQQGRVEGGAALVDQSHRLEARRFSTCSWYGGLQASLTPAGLAFFQAAWDPAVRTYMHRDLGIAEPMYEFIHPEKYRPPQEKIPHKHPFDIYLDMYRDRKDIGEEVLKEKLKEVGPFSPPAPPPRFKNLAWLPNTMPTWLQDQQRDKMFRRGKYALWEHRE